MSARKLNVMSRPVLMHICTNGMITLKPIYVDKPGYQQDWRAPIVDALMEGSIAKASKLFKNHDRLSSSERREAGEDSTEPDDRESFTLPFFSVYKHEHAVMLRVRFCKLGYGEHPLNPGDSQYIHNNFTGEIDDIYRLQREFEAQYQKMLVRVDDWTIQSYIERPDTSPAHRRLGKLALGEAVTHKSKRVLDEARKKIALAINTAVLADGQERG